MKKIFITIMILVLSLSMVGCFNSTQKVSTLKEKEITIAISDFMSKLTNLDFEGASNYLEEPKMAEYLTCELTNNVVEDYLDIFTSSAWWLIEEPIYEQEYQEIFQKPFDYIKENMSYEITEVKKKDGTYLVSLDLECIDICKLLTVISECSSLSLCGEIASDAAFYFTQNKAEDEYTEEDVEKVIIEACLDVAGSELENDVYSILNQCKKEEFNIELKVVETENGLKISKETDMNFVRVLIM